MKCGINELIGNLTTHYHTNVLNFERSIWWKLSVIRTHNSLNSLGCSGNLDNEEEGVVNEDHGENKEQGNLMIIIKKMVLMKKQRIGRRSDKMKLVI